AEHSDSYDDYEPEAGSAVERSSAPQNPGLPDEEHRVTDKDDKAARTAERRIAMFFGVSVVGSIFATVAYVVFPIIPGDMTSVRLNNGLMGLGITLGLLGIGFGAVYWAKNLMSDEEMIEERHPTRGDDETREKATQVFSDANKESGFTRRSLVRNSMIGALLATPIPAVVLFRDLAPSADPIAKMKQTMWDTGVRLARDPSGEVIRAADVTIGAAFHVIPEGLKEIKSGKLEEKAKAAVLLMRLPVDNLNPTEDRKDWSYQGIVAYSKICTHVGCPVALYEQQTHHLLCPCHQSQFDVSNQCEVIFGPAARPLPQLPITVDAEGYLIAQSDFTEPVGPSFWEREL
ncbi:MAG: Rieske 2Fe-2S domain-containing protein, partial [Pontimonas sp.]